MPIISISLFIVSLESAAFWSTVTNKEILLSDPCLEGISFDGDEFERGYAAKSLAGGKMYVKEEK